MTVRKCPVVMARGGSSPNRQQFPSAGSSSCHELAQLTACPRSGAYIVSLGNANGALGVHGAADASGGVTPERRTPYLWKRRMQKARDPSVDQSLGPFSRSLPFLCSHRPRTIDPTKTTRKASRTRTRSIWPAVSHRAYRVDRVALGA